tara:strand:- start:2034 stop:2528 length:495 start_codon:yes stop_codon:yes gene_type:complete
MSRDKLVAYKRELHNILSEEDRKKINQVLTTFSNTKKTVPTVVTKKKGSSSVPHISELVVHDEFQFQNLPEEFDEVPHLFLFRINFTPIIFYKKKITLLNLQELCAMSGVHNIVHDNVTTTMQRLSGSFEKGGMVKSVILYLEKTETDEFVFIKKCIFKGLKGF